MNIYFQIEPGDAWRKGRMASLNGGKTLFLTDGANRMNLESVEWHVGADAVIVTGFQKLGGGQYQLHTVSLKFSKPRTKAALERIDSRGKRKQKKVRQ
jgi:hypothetical protein